MEAPTPALPADPPRLGTAIPAGREERSGAWAAAALAFFLAAALASAFAFGLPPLDRDESRFAQASVQMLESHDFVRISFQDSARNKKPALIHWLQAAAVATVSAPERRAIWAFRLPSILAAALTALASSLAATRLFGRRAGLAAGLLMATAVELCVEGAIAKTDSALSACSALAFLGFVELYRLRRRDLWAERRGAWLFWAAIGAGIMLKGPVIALIAGGGALAFLAFEARAGRSLAFARPLLFPSGWLLALIIALPWYVAIEIATRGAFLRDAASHDFAAKLAHAQEGHSAPPGLYALLAPILLTPASLFLLSGLVPAFRAIGRTMRGTTIADGPPPAWALPLIWALPAWLTFEAVPTKLVHYTLPLFPMLTVLAGGGFALWAEAKRRAPWASLILLAGLMALFLAAAALFQTLALGTAARPGFAAVRAQAWAIGPALAIAGLFGLAVVALRGRRIMMALAAVTLMGAGADLALAYAAARAASATPSVRLSAALAAAHWHPRLSRPDGPRLIVVGYHEPSLVFLTRTDTWLADLAAAAAETQSGSVLALDLAASYGSIADPAVYLKSGLAARGLAWRPGAPVTGFNYSKGRQVRIVFGLVAAAPPGNRQ